MLSLKIDISGLKESGDEIARDIKTRAYQGASRLFDELYDEVRINLSDNILRIRSGKLIDSMETTSYMESVNDVISAFVGTDTKYAAYQEFGYTGTQQVNGYTRTVSSVFGKPIGGSVEEVIAAFTRNVNYAGRPYIGPALAKIALNVGAVLSTEINR